MPATKLAEFAAEALSDAGEVPGVPHAGAPPAWLLPPAAPPPPPPPDAAAYVVATQRMPRLLASLWRLSWENGVKATYWLVALNGIKCGESVTHTFGISHCHLCGGTESHGRMHVFWRCEGALAVRTALQVELARLGVLAPLRRRQLWLMLRPSRAIHNDLWRVVCLAAFAGMDAGRCAAWLVPRTAPLTPGHLIARIVRTCALATFQSMLADYAALGLCRPAARASVAAPRPAFFFVAHPHDPRALALRPAGT